MEGKCFLVNDVLLTSIVSLGSSVIGALIAYATQSRTVSKQIKYDNEKNEKLKEIEKVEKERLKKVERVQLANEILFVEGEHSIMWDSRQGYYNFDEESYFKNVRPLIYSKFHLFDTDTRDLIRVIDALFAIARHHEEMDREILDLIVRNYSKFISRIAVISSREIES